MNKVLPAVQLGITNNLESVFYHRQIVFSPLRAVNDSVMISTIRIMPSFPKMQQSKLLTLH